MMNRSAVRFKIPVDVWLGLAMSAGAVAYWIAADQIPISPLDGQVNAAMMPKTFATILTVLGVLLVLRAILIERAYLRAARSATTAAEMPAARTQNSTSGPSGLKTHLRSIGMLAIGVVYLQVLSTLGYMLSIGLLVGAVSVYMGARPNWHTLAVAAGASVVFYLIFVQLLGIPLPAGFWPSLPG